jgi:hypothetical protein
LDRSLVAVGARIPYEQGGASLSMYQSGVVERVDHEGQAIHIRLAPKTWPRKWAAVIKPPRRADGGIAAQSAGNEGIAAVSTDSERERSL